MPLHLGTSGWQYRHWRETFYPKGVPQREWLEFFAARFDTVELNNSFYMLPKPESFAAWRERTPAGFCFAVKVSRFVSHIKKLVDVEASLALILERARLLGDKLGPLLLQLPPTLPADAARLDAALAAIPRDVEVAVEFRHETWFSDEVRRVLERRRAALVLPDAGGPVSPPWRTAGWGYLRFHSGRGRPSPCYRRAELEEWADRVAATWSPRDRVYAYFNNDPKACALRDAVRFAEAMERRGWSVGKRPAEAEIHVGDPPPVKVRATRAQQAR